MSLHKLKHQRVMFAAFGCLSKLNSWYFSPDGFINSLSMLSYLLWAQLITNKNLSSRCHMIVWGPLLPFPPLSLLFLICSHSLGPVGSLQMLGLEGLYQWKHTAVVCAYGGHLCLQPEWLIFSTVPWQGPKWGGVMCSTASGGTERVSVGPGNYSLSHFPKVKLPDQRNRNRLHAMAFKEYPLWWMLGSSEGLSQT